MPSQIADSACPFLYWSQCKKGHAESAFRDTCRTSSGPAGTLCPPASTLCPISYTVSPVLTRLRVC